MTHLIIRPNMSYGYRFDHENNKHDDRAVVLGMRCVSAASTGPDLLHGVQKQGEYTKENPRSIQESGVKWKTDVGG